jgi:hypothetical protein
MGANAIDQIRYGGVQPGAVSPAGATGSVGAEEAVPATAKNGEQGAVHLDVMPSSPPDDVIDAIGVAADAFDRLAANGQHVSFELDRPTGSVQINLQDSSGRPISGLSPSDALRLAAGGSLD